MDSKTLFRAFLSLVLLFVATTFMKAVELMEHHEMHVVAKERIGNIDLEAMKSISTEPLEHEKMFINTLKDCIPSVEQVSNENKGKKECKTFIPEGSKERIAVMAPPGKMDVSLLKFIRIVLMKGKKGNDGEFAATQVEVIPTTNMVSIVYQESCTSFKLVSATKETILSRDPWRMTSGKKFIATETNYY
jgi:hypothetical protein